MMRYIYYLAIWMVAVLVTGYQAQAGQCADRQIVAQRLAAVYGETRQSVSAAPDGSVVEVFVARHTGSWTITATPPDGATCLVAAGQAFDWRVQWLTALQVAAPDHAWARPHGYLQPSATQISRRPVATNST